MSTENNSSYAVNLTSSDVSLLISGYLRENNLFKCFHAVIYKYFPMLLLLKDATINSLTNEITILKKGRCILDIGLNTEKYEVIVIITDMNDKFLRLPSFGFCSNINMNFDCGKYEHYFGSVDSGNDLDITLSEYTSNFKPVKFCVNGKVKFDPQFDPIKFCNKQHNGNNFKWIIDCDKGMLSFYWNDNIWSDVSNDKIQVVDGKYLIDKNQIYHPIVEKSISSASKLKFKLVVNSLR